MDSAQYRKLQEDHVSNLNGTSRFETIIQVVPIPLSTFLSLLAVPLFVSQKWEKKWRNFLISVLEFCILILPITTTLTVFNDNLNFIIISLISLMLLATYANTRKCSRREYQQYLQLLWVSEIPEKNAPFITMFRAITSLVTALCIFAVDFNIFPRKFAKTEYFGYSVMDVGVGLFCVSNAIVCPEVRYVNNQACKSAKFVLKTALSCLPLLLLGFARFFTLKSFDYQVHVSEYGVHWNFFITLAFVKILSSVIMYVTSRKYVWQLSVLTILCHQCFLSAGMQEWVLDHNTVRSDLLTANREGLVSLSGYLAIYFAGMYIGSIIRKTGSLFSENIHLALKLAVVVLMLWHGTVLLEYLFGVSRRLTNSGYVIWVLCVSVIFLEMFLLCSLAAHCIKMFVSVGHKPLTVKVTYVPVLFEAVNFNGLACFLLSNILTGTFNLCFYTLTFSECSSIFIVLLYMYIVCLSMSVLYWKKIKLKFW